MHRNYMLCNLRQSDVPTACEVPEPGTECSRLTWAWFTVARIATCLNQPFYSPMTKKIIHIPPRVTRMPSLLGLLAFIKRIKHTYLNIPQGASSEMPHSQWVVYKVILPAKLLSIKGDELYSVYFTSLILLLHLTHEEVIAPKANPLWAFA